MNEAQKNDVENYIAEIAGLMGLTDWHFVLKVESQEDMGEGLTTLAHVSWTPGRRHALINLGLDFFGNSPDIQRMVIVHELTHCHLATMQDQVEKDLEPHLGRVADELFSLSFRRNLEFAVDGIATAWAEKLPMIEWSDGDRESNYRALTDEQLRLFIGSPDPDIKRMAIAEADRRELVL